MPTEPTAAAPNWKHTIGIVGGLGPYAHLELERLILAAANNLLARPLNDQDYPPWLLVSLPGCPDRTAATVGTGPSPVPWLVRSLQMLRGCADVPRADFGVIACNNAHAFLPEVRAAATLPVLDVVEETILAAAQLDPNVPRVGILATTGTLRSNVYQKAARGRLDLISLLDLPDGERLQERLVMEPIFGQLRDGRRAGGGIKSGADDAAACRAHQQALLEAVGHLAAAGAQLVLLACSELRLGLGGATVDGVTLMDPMQIAAEAAVAIAVGRRPLPK
jgi:aspartate racemase